MHDAHAQMTFIMCASLSKMKEKKSPRKKI